MGSIRINKGSARHFVEEGYTVKLIPCNLRLGSIWFEPFYIDKEVLKKYDSNFDKAVNEYDFYNCNNNEVGKYPHFYLHIENTLGGATDKCYTYAEAKKLYKELHDEAEKCKNEP